MSELDKPHQLRNLPVDPAEATLELLRRLGPLTENEFKYGLKHKFRKHTLNALVEEGKVILVDQDPVPVYGLPEHRKNGIDKGFLF